MSELHDVRAKGDVRQGGGDLDLELAIGWLMHDVHRLLSRAFDEKFRELGLTRAQWRVMIHLLREDGMTQKELAELDSIEKAPMGRLLDKLEEMGWIERRPDPLDGRARRVFRTGKIEPLLPDIKLRASEIFERAFEGLPRDAREDLRAELAAIRDRLSGTRRPAGSRTPRDCAARGLEPTVSR